MPNYDNRRYRAEEARREAEHLRMNYPRGNNTQMAINSLLEEANMLEEQNKREQPDRYDADMRVKHGTVRYEYKEHPGRYNPQDRPRNNMDNRYDSNPDISNMVYPYYPSPIYNNSNPNDNHNRNMSSGGYDNNSKHKIGFSSGKVNNNEKTHMEEEFNELSEYANDWIKHSKAYEQTNDPTEKQHMLLELEEFINIFEDVYKKLMKHAKTPEERNKFKQMSRNMTEN